MPIPSSRSVRKMRIAISPRLATSTLRERPIDAAYSPEAVTPRRSADRRARASPCPFVVVALRVGLRRPRLLGDRALHRGDGDRLVRRAARAPHRPAPRRSARCSTRSRTRCSSSPCSIVLDRRGRRSPAGWSPRSSRASSSSPACGWRRSSAASSSRARDLGKLKTWSQAVAAAIGGFAAAGAWDDDVAWWALLVAVVLTWVSGLDYARFAPQVLRGRAMA